MSGLPRSARVRAAPLFHLKITSSPAFGVVSRISSFDLAGTPGVRQLERGASRHPSVGSHTSQSAQSSVVLLPQTPFVQTSPTVQASPSSQAVSSGTVASGGQVSPTPSQLSAASQTPTAGRQTL